MKTKGFTLIELLAVVVVLAIIALIATPLVLNTIEKSKQGAFEQTMNGVVKASELYQAKELLSQPIEECRYFSFDRKITEITRDEETNKLYYPVGDLNLKGNIPTEGEVKICEKEIVVEVGNGEYSGRYDGKDTNTAAKMLFKTCGVSYRQFIK